MSSCLQSLESPIREQNLVEALRKGRDLPVRDLPRNVDLGLLDQAIQDAIEAGVRESALDTVLIEPLHRALRGMDEVLKTDMRIWHWLTVVRYPDVVWYRWRGSVPADAEEGFVRGNGRRPVPAVRFLGTPSINGHGRNTFARLFFAAERLVGAGDSGYALVRRLFNSQELHLGISDREYGLLPQVSRVLTRKLADLPDQQVRAGVRNLNALGGSICLDLLDEAEIENLISADPVQASRRV